ncbi:MAG: hypothetical protein ACR2NP_02610 [Pirellulaceae bacterium]
MSPFAPTKYRTHWLMALVLPVLIAWLTGNSLLAQSTVLVNGDMESESDNGMPAGWFAPPMMVTQGYKFTLDGENPVSGEFAALIDAREIAEDAGFGNLMQNINAKPWQGKRVRFRAAVRTADLKDDARAQMWLRVDRPEKNGQRQTGAFDNMDDRPIRDDGWDHYEIVLDVADDAEKIALGLFILGKGRVWLDDASLEVADDETATTGGALTDAGPDPFFNHWLWLPVIALLLFGLSYLPLTDEPGLLQKFALRFSVAYWLMYSLPQPFTALLFSWGQWLNVKYQWVVDKVVRWTASDVLGIDYQLAQPGGSGDTTFDFVRIFACFCLAVGIAVIWSLIDHRRTAYPWTRDLLRSYLRYVLAFTMLGYGLAKLGTVYNQFSPPGVERLLQPYGESSPMGLVWTFMGASQAYTIFAGLGETLGALLLIWRRTTLLGALVTIGVMTNVVMLNFCYDVPVKQYSFHLVIMAVYLLLPDAGRLANILLWNKPTESVNYLRPPYVNDKTVWVHRLIKAYIIVVGIAVPVWQNVRMELNQPESVGEPEWFGTYRVELFTQNGDVVLPNQEDGSRWNLVTFRQFPWIPGGSRNSGPVDFMTIRMMNGSPSGGAVKLSEPFPPFLSDDLHPDMEGARYVLTHRTDAATGPLHIRVFGDGSMLINTPGTEPFPDGNVGDLRGTIDPDQIEIRLRKVEREDFLLVNRGFHWINERPYNR